jgi:hypothetical protein
MKTLNVTPRLHHLTEEDTALYVDALKLDRVHELPADIRSHVQACDRCKADVLALHEMMPNEMYHTGMKHPYFDTTVHEPNVHYLFPSYRVAAAVAGVALVGAGYYYIASSHSTESIAAKHPSTSLTQQPVPQKLKKEENLLAANFEPSPNLEGLVQNDFRSTSIEALSPVVGKVTSQPITFKWKNYDGPVTLKVLTNKEETVFTSTTEASNLTMKKNLIPGLYYWKLETDEELLFVGKFIVK